MCGRGNLLQPPLSRGTPLNGNPPFQIAELKTLPPLSPILKLLNPPKVTGGRNYVIANRDWLNADYWFFMGLKLMRNWSRNQGKQLCIIETHYNHLEHPSSTSSHVLMKYKILKKGGTPTLNQLSTHGYWDHIFPRYRGWYPSVLKTAQYPL